MGLYLGCVLYDSDDETDASSRDDEDICNEVFGDSKDFHTPS